MIKKDELILWNFYIDCEGSGDMKIYRALKDFDAEAEKAKWEGKREYYFDFLEDSGFVEIVPSWIATEEDAVVSVEENGMKFNRHCYNATISDKLYPNKE